MNLFDFLEDISKKGYSSIEDYCNEKGCDVCDVVDDPDDD